MNKITIPSRLDPLGKEKKKKNNSIFVGTHIIIHTQKWLERQQKRNENFCFSIFIDFVAPVWRQENSSSPATLHHDDI
jgi:hypothetical protein